MLKKYIVPPYLDNAVAAKALRILTDVRDDLLLTSRKQDGSERARGFDEATDDLVDLLKLMGANVSVTVADEEDQTEAQFAHKAALARRLAEDRPLTVTTDDRRADVFPEWVGR